MRRFRIIKAKGEWLKAKGLLLLSLFIFHFSFYSCENTTFRSSVPTYPVRFSIDTRIGSFVHFKPTSLNEHVVVNQDGYFYNGKWLMARGVTDAYGYAGVVVFVSMNGYEAFDAACPECASHGRRTACDIDGIYAVCPYCGEQYDLGMGTGVPQRGIAHEGLRRYNYIVSDGKITVTQ